MKIIKPFIGDYNVDSKNYFQIEKNRILKTLSDNNKNIIHDELLKFIYNK